MHRTSVLFKRPTEAGAWCSRRRKLPTNNCACDDALTNKHQTQQVEPNYRVALPGPTLMNDPHIQGLPASVWVCIF